MLKYLTSVFLFVLAGNNIFGQISISPEVGISYSPFEVIVVSGIGDVPKAESNKPNLYIGLSAQIPIHEQWYVKTRLGYNNRAAVSWSHCGFAHCKHFEYKHKNINIDALLYRKLFSNFDVAIGASIIKKFESRLIAENEGDRGEVNSYNEGFNYYGVTIGASYSFKYFSVNIDYMRKINTDYQFVQFDTCRSRSRLNATISVPIRTQRKESQHKKKKKKK